MVVRVLGPGECRSRGEVVHVPGMGVCEVCDDARLGTAAQLKIWLASARLAAKAAGLLVKPRLGRVLPHPDRHVYLALDANGNVAAQITGT